MGKRGPLPKPKTVDHNKKMGKPWQPAPATTKPSPAMFKMCAEDLHIVAAHETHCRGCDQGLIPPDNLHELFDGYMKMLGPLE